MRQLPDEFASLLKDKLRGARYVVRHGARLGQDVAAFAPGMPDMARLAERLLVATERTASALVLGEQDFEDPCTVLQVWEAMRAAPDDAARKRLFVRIQYRLTKAVLQSMGAENVFISEHKIALAYEVLLRRHRKLLSGRPAREADTVRFWVAAAVALAACQPLREIDLPRRPGPQTRYLEQAPTPFCLLIVALTGAIVTTRPPADGQGAAAEGSDEGLAGYIESAAAVVTARFDRFSVAFVRQDGAEAGGREARAIETLAEEFRQVLPFLP